jgi:hypothetical protein
MPDATSLPPGYRQGLITSITVMLSASILFFRFVVFEPTSGPWTRWGTACAILAGLSILMQLFTLWRALQPGDEQLPVYNVTLRWFGFAVLVLICSLAADTIADAIY